MTLVWVSGTVSTPRLLKLLSVPSMLGGFSDGIALLAKACSRIRLAALSASSLPGWLAGCENTEAAGRSALSAANVLRQFSSVTCIARALKPPFCPGGAARLDAFFAIDCPPDDATGILG